MKISHIEHLGIAVKSIEEALPYYEKVLGLTCYNIETVEDQKVKTAFLKCGDTKIELLDQNRIIGTDQPGQYHCRLYRKTRHGYPPPRFCH